MNARAPFVAMLLLLVVQTMLLKQVASFTSSSLRTIIHQKRTRQSSLALRMMAASSVVPRAAVSVVVRYQQQEENDDDPRFILIQRGQEPNKGLWSLPGGKLEFGETTLEGAQRELQEECQLSHSNLEWYEGGAFCVTDYLSPQVQYSICTCFAAAASESSLPVVVPSDDAADAKWITLSEMQDHVDRGEATDGVLKVIQRAEQLYEAGLL